MAYFFFADHHISTFGRNIATRKLASINKQPSIRAPKPQGYAFMPKEMASMELCKDLANKSALSAMLSTMAAKLMTLA